LFPLIGEEVVEEVVVPLHRIRGPRTFESARNGAVGISRSERVLPTKALLFERRGLGFATDELIGVTGTVGLSERVSSGDQRDGLFVVHRHPCEGLANVARGGQGIGVTVGPFGINVNQTHLDRTQRIVEFAVTGVALVAEPGLLRSPEHIFIGLPRVDASARKTKCFQSHRLNGQCAGEDHEVGPGDLSAVLLLDRPQQPARFVEVDVVGPAVQRCKALVARPRTTTAVTNAIRAGTVPGHANEEGAVVAVVGGPPVLGRHHEFHHVLLHRLEVEARELFGVVELFVHWIGGDRVASELLEIQLIRPPVAIRRAGARDRAPIFVVHDSPSSLFVSVNESTAPRVTSPIDYEYQFDKFYL
jgi:hypothetical protein